MIEFRGEVFMLRIVEREKYAPLVELYTEDDENWFHKDTFDSGWLRDLKSVVDAAVVVLAGGGTEGWQE